MMQVRECVSRRLQQTAVLDWNMLRVADIGCRHDVGCTGVQKQPDVELVLIRTNTTTRWPPLILTCMYFFHLRQWSVAIKDTIDEFVEAAKNARLANAGNSDGVEKASGLEEQFAAKATVGGKESGEEDGEGDAFDFDDMDEDYSAAELQCVETTVDILRVFRRCLKAANEAFNTLDSAPSQGVMEEGAGASAGPAGEGWLQGKLGWAKVVQGHLEDANECAGEVGILLYPPLDGGELLGRATDLERSLTSFCEAFYAREEGGDGRNDSPLTQAVEDKMGALRAAAEAL